MTTYLTPTQVAEMWGCTPEHVQRLCARGELRAMKLGRRGWRISEEAVTDFEVRHANEPEAAPELSIPRRALARPLQPRAVEMDRPYALVVKGPVPWRSSVLPETGARRG